MSTVRRFRAIGGFKDDVLYIEHVDGKSYGIIKEDFSNAYPLSTCERLVNKGQWEEIPTDAQLNREGTMKEELKRRDQAIGHLFRRLNEVASQTFWNTVYEEVQGLLNPAPIMEPVEEIVGWVNVYQHESGEIACGTVYTDKLQADRIASGRTDFLSCQPVKVTVMREKPMLVTHTDSFQISSDGIIWSMDGTVADYLHDKVVDVTWTEEPTT